MSPMKLIPLVFSFIAMIALAAETPAPVVPPKPVPVIDPAKALAGEALVKALRGGGYVMYMRHAKYAQITEKCDQKNLAPDGEAEARKVGAALRERKIPIGSVRASTLCRAIESAQFLDVGPVETTPDLLPSKKPDVPLQLARRKLLSETPKRGTNTILVSHTQDAEDKQDELTLGLCEIIVFRPDGKGGRTAVARIRPDDWAALPK